MRERINLTELFGPRDPKEQAIVRLQMDLAGELYDLRTAKGMSYADVAALTGVSASVIESIEESDYEPRRSRRILDTLAKALDQESPASLNPTAAAGAV